MSQQLELQLLTENDAFELCQLINSAYRGEDGWTKETDIVSGDRTNIEDTKELITNSESHLLIARKNKNIIACVCIEKKENQAYIRLLAVNSKYQNMGLGKQILHLAEEYAVKKLSAKEFIMVVISQRKELINFYERRGYKKNWRNRRLPCSS